MRHQKIIMIFLITLSCFLFIKGLWEYFEQRPDVEITEDESMENMLFELGQIRLRMTRHWEFDQPREFFIFNHRQKIRKSGFDPVWRDDRYILKNMGSGGEVDFFRSRSENRFNLRKKINQDKFVREVMSAYVDYSARIDEELLAKIYHLQLNGFHLVSRHTSFFGNKFLFVKDIRKNDLIIALEELLLLDASISYNCAEEFGGGVRSEVILRERGFIMKERGDVCFPVYLKTGGMPELPPKEIFIYDALNRINEYAKWRGKADLTIKHIDSGIGSRGRFLGRPYYVDRVMLELYGFAIRWDKSREQYEMVQQSKPQITANEDP